MQCLPTYQGGRGRVYPYYWHLHACMYVWYLHFHAVQRWLLDVFITDDVIILAIAGKQTHTIRCLVEPRPLAILTVAKTT